jgi:transcriptional regulator with XRE-family HTH domain
MTQPSDILDELRELRVAAKRSQEDISYATGYHRSQIIRYEARTHTPRLDAVCNWAEALGYELVLRPKE